MPLAPAYDWVDVIVGFDTLAAAAAYANALGEQDGLLVKQLAVVAAPVAARLFPAPPEIPAARQARRAR